MISGGNLLVKDRRMETKLLVGYNTSGATNRWLIRGQEGGKLRVCRFNILDRLDGTHFLSTEKEQFRSDIVDIHEETYDL